MIPIKPFPHKIISISLTAYRTTFAQSDSDLSRFMPPLCSAINSYTCKDRVQLGENPNTDWIIDVWRAGRDRRAFCVQDKIIRKSAVEVMRGMICYKNGINYENRIF